MCRTPAPADVDRAVARGARAPSTPGHGTTRRRRIAAACCSSWREIVRERADELAELETRNTGKPIVEAEFDVADVATCFEYLRRPRDEDPRRRHPGARQRDEPGAARADRRRRPDHPVELSAADGGVEARAGDLRRLHDGAEAGRADAADASSRSRRASPTPACRPASSTSSPARAKPPARRSSSTPTSTRSRSPAASKSARRSCAPPRRR